MKVVQKNIYVAFDGTEFDSRSKCEAHEMETPDIVRFGLSMVGRDKQVLKNSITRSEMDIKYRRKNTMKLLVTRRVTRSATACERLSKEFGVLAQLLKRRDDLMFQLAKTRDEQRRLRGILDSKVPAEGGAE